MKVSVEEELVPFGNRKSRHSAMSAWLAAGALLFGCVLGGESAMRGIVRTVGTNGMVSTVEACEGVEVESGDAPVHGLKI